MSLGKLFTTIFIVLFLSGNAFAEGSKFDRFATDAEVTAQERRDVGITPANIPYIKAAAANATVEDTLTLKDAIYTHIIKAINEPGLGGRLTIGLDETARTFVVCDAGDVDTDFGLIASADPRLVLFRNTGGNPLEIKFNVITFNYTGTIQGNNLTFKGISDLAAGDMFYFTSAANIELTDTDGEQSWFYIEPKINQSATAAYNGLKIKATITAEGDATTGDGGGTNNLILAGTSTDPDMFKVDNVGRICVAESSDPSALADHVFFYGKNVTGTAEAFAADAGANVAQLTAHNDKLFNPDPNERYPWMPYYKNSALGVEAGFDMSRALRDLQDITGTTYIHYRDTEKSTNLEKTYREQWIRNYIESGIQETEIPKIQALETIEIDERVLYEFEVSYKECDENGACINKIKTVKRGKKICSKIIGYELVDGEVKEKIEIVWETRKVDKFQLKKGIRFSEVDGKFYIFVKPTRAEAITAAEKDFEFMPPKWLGDRLTKADSR